MERIKMYHEREYTSYAEPDYLRKAQINKVSVLKTSRIINKIFDSIPQGSSLIILLMPDLHYLKGELSIEYQNMKSIFIGKLKNEIKVLDLHDKLTPDMYYPIDGHWNPKGHKFVSDSITKFLKM